MRATSPALPSTAEAIEFLDELRRDLRFSDRLDAHIKEPIRFSVRGTDAPKRVMNPSPKTACWSFRGDSPGAHLIHFCLGLFEKLRATASWQEYLTAYAHHELLHACVTPRDLRSITDDLKNVGLSFRDYNLFEDARIEALGRKEFDFPLAWTEHEEVTAAENPRGYFFNLIQNAGIDHPDLVSAAFTSEPWVARVRDYYFPRAIAAHDFPVMRALIVEWVKEFPPANDGAGKNGTQPTMGDLELGANISEEAFAAMVELAAEQAGEKSPDKDGATSMGNIQAVKLGEDATDEALAAAPVRTVDQKLANQAANRLRGLLEPSRRRERSAFAAKRISARAFHLGRTDFYRRTVDATKSRPVKIAYFIDCSGSMGAIGPDGATAIDGGISLAMGLNLLAQRGLVVGHIILHKGENTKALCSAYALPLPEEFFTRIPNDGGWEGLESAFKRSAPLITKADYVFCYTDGHICDETIDTAALAARGVQPVGLYCGEADAAANLSRWFPRVLIRESVMDLLEAVVSSVDFSQTRRGR